MHQSVCVEEVAVRKDRSNLWQSLLFDTLNSICHIQLRVNENTKQFERVANAIMSIQNTEMFLTGVKADPCLNSPTMRCLLTLNKVLAN
jgi:hypothetical protein